MRGTIPPSYFMDPFLYRHRHQFTATEIIPESPFYCPRLSFFTIIRNKRCNPQIYDLLCDMRDLTGEIIESELVGPREPSDICNSTPESIHSRVNSLPSASSPGHGTSGDWTYESCRLSASIYCFHQCSSSATNLTEVVSLLSLIQNLHLSLARSDVSNCWDDMAGVLFWCVLVGSNSMYHALRMLNANIQLGQNLVSDSDLQRHGNCLRWLRLLAVRTGVLLGFQHPEAICVTLRRFIRAQYRTSDLSKRII
jgi:hypothetical protein